MRFTISARIAASSAFATVSGCCASLRCIWASIPSKRTECSSGGVPHVFSMSAALMCSCPPRIRLSAMINVTSAATASLVNDECGRSVGPSMRTLSDARVKSSSAFWRTALADGASVGVTTGVVNAFASKRGLLLTVPSYQIECRFTGVRTLSRALRSLVE